jgi:hypothetical protein
MTTDMGNIEYYSALREPVSESSVQTGGGSVLGIYDPNSMVVNFSPSIEAFIRAASEGKQDPSLPLNKAAVQLTHYSTYIHETTHWWQFIASTTGFIQTLGSMAQSLLAAIYMRRISPSFPLCKPLIAQVRSDKTAAPQGDWQKLHTLVNSWLDIEFGICCVNSPKKLASFRSDNFFESVGISLYTLYRDALQTFHNQFPKTRSILPIADWESKFIRVRDARYPNFHHQSPAYLPSLGALAIFEGQARFTQLQFLHNALDGKTNLNDWRTQLHGVYIEAFEHFLKVLAVPWPEKANDPLVNTFLLLCDIAMNPSFGFPEGIETFAGFIEAVHAGHRFHYLCMLVARSPQVVDALSSVNRHSYLQTMAFICGSLGWKTPLDVAAKWLHIYLEADLLSDLIKLRNNHDFTRDAQGVSMSMPVRLAASRQVSLLQDKLRMPEVFCWAGHYLGIGVRGHSESVLTRTLNKHPAPFAILNEYKDGPIVYLCGVDTTPPDDQKAKEVIEQHFSVQMSADVMRQTIARHGDYAFNYMWDNPNIGIDLRARARRSFTNLTGRHLESINIL